MIAGTVQAGAAELKLLVGGAMSEPFHEVAEAFEKKTGPSHRDDGRQYRRAAKAAEGW